MKEESVRLLKKMAVFENEHVMVICKEHGVPS
jgi:hypothetical protein